MQVFDARIEVPEEKVDFLRMFLEFVEKQGGKTVVTEVTKEDLEREERELEVNDGQEEC